MNRLKWGKAPGICGIHAELLKAGGNAALMLLHAVLCSPWNTGIIPTDWKRGLVVPLWKGKGDRQDCNNYRGVMLLSVPGKVFARIIIDRVRHHLLEHQRSGQSGFTPKRSTVDRILALRVLNECRREFLQGLLAAYFDLCPCNVHLLFPMFSVPSLSLPQISSCLCSALFCPSHSLPSCLMPPLP